MSPRTATAVDIDDEVDTVAPTESEPQYDFDDPELLSDDVEEEDASPGSVDEGDPDEEEEAPAADQPVEEEPEEDEPAGEDAPAAESDEDAPDLSALDLDPEIYEDSLVGAFKVAKDLVAESRKELTALREEVKVLREREQQREAEVWFNEFDQVVGSLREPKFGTGNRKELSEAQFKARRDLLSEMEVIQAGRQQKGLERLPVADLVKRAMGALGHTAKPRATVVARPGRSQGAREGADLSPEQRAIRSVRAKLREIQVDEDDPDF